MRRDAQRVQDTDEDGVVRARLASVPSSAASDATSTRLRPRAFAAYIAASAAPTSCSIDQGGSALAAPIETVTEDGRALAWHRVHSCRDGTSRALRRDARPRFAGLRQRQDELFASPAAHEVTLARHANEHACHASEHRVARRVPTLVVDALEVIDVQKQSESGNT